MPAALSRPDTTASAVPAASHAAQRAPESAPATPAPPARLADEQAVPAPSPVHQLQAGLAQLTAPPEPEAEPLFPGWFRLGFPLVSSVLLWAAILWGASRLA